ncbi:MAG: TRAP transporter large permease subunit [Gammaproteobacteria bacterium]
MRHFLTSLPGGFWGQFIMVMVVIFLLGFFPGLYRDCGSGCAHCRADFTGRPVRQCHGGLAGRHDWPEYPDLVPDLPPFGFALFYLRGVASAAVKTLEMYRGVIPFIILQLLALVIVANYPKLVNYVPTRISLTSDTAPPPLNPRLQFCLEENLLREYVTRESELRDAIARARQLDMSYVPAGLRKDVEGALDKADRTFDLLGEIRQAEAIVIAAQADYRPLHTKGACD